MLRLLIVKGEGGGSTWGDGIWRKPFRDLGGRMAVRVATAEPLGSEIRSPLGG